MPSELRKPSLGSVRAGLIQEWLTAQSAEAAGRLPVVAATGKTFSGKSTLGNLLAGTDDLLASTGRQDCTDAVHLVRFARGLTYVDLPGVASDDRLENVNRLALGLPLLPAAPVSGIKVYEYNVRAPSAERDHPADRIPHGLIEPDLLLYLIAPHQHLAQSEEPYLADLLRRSGPGRIVFVLNMFHRGGVRLATPQNITDVRRKLESLHRDVRVVAMDCLTGDGLTELLVAVQTSLGGDSALSEVLTYQTERAPGRYRALIGKAVRDFVAPAALTVLTDETAEDEPTSAAEPLWGYTDRLAGRPGKDRSPWLEDFRRLAATVAAGRRRELTEPVIEQRSTDVYQQVPEYQWVEEVDHSRPIYGNRLRRVEVPATVGDLNGFIELGLLIGRALFGERTMREEWVTESVVVGYEKRNRQVVVGERQEYVRTDRWDEVVGERVVGVVYDPLGSQGVALLLSAWYTALQVIGGDRAPDARGAYECIVERNTLDDPMPADTQELLMALLAQPADE